MSGCMLVTWCKVFGQVLLPDMQARHDEEAAALAKRRANFQRDRDQLAKEAETEYEDACERAAFKLQVLSPCVDVSCA